MPIPTETGVQSFAHINSGIRYLQPRRRDARREPFRLIFQCFKCALRVQRAPFSRPPWSRLYSNEPPCSALVNRLSLHASFDDLTVLLTYLLKTGEQPVYVVHVASSTRE